MAKATLSNREWDRRGTWRLQQLDIRIVRIKDSYNTRALSAWCTMLKMCSISLHSGYAPAASNGSVRPFAFALDGRTRIQLHVLIRIVEACILSSCGRPIATLVRRSDDSIPGPRQIVCLDIPKLPRRLRSYLYLTRRRVPSSSISPDLATDIGYQCLLDRLEVIDANWRLSIDIAGLQRSVYERKWSSNTPNLYSS